MTYNYSHNHQSADEHVQDQFVADFGKLLSANFHQLSSQPLDTTYNAPTGLLGRQIRAARLRKKWTPNQIAEKLHKNEAYIYAIEHGMIPADTIEPTLITDLARILEQEPSPWLEILKSMAPNTPHLWQRKIRTYWAKLHFDMPNLAIGSLQGMVTSVAAIAIVCLLMMPNGRSNQMSTTSTEAVPTVAANIYTPSLDYATYARFSSYICNPIQPEWTSPSLECNQLFALWSKSGSSERRGGPSEA